MTSATAPAPTHRVNVQANLVDDFNKKMKIEKILRIVSHIAVAIFVSFLTFVTLSVTALGTLAAMKISIVGLCFLTIGVIAMVAAKILLEKLYHPDKTHDFMNMFLARHVYHQEFTPELAKRMLFNYLKVLDPFQTFFLKGDIQRWLEPTDELLQTIIDGYRQNQFPVFKEIDAAFAQAIILRQEIDGQNLPMEWSEGISPDEILDFPWVDSKQDLVKRISKVFSFFVHRHLLGTPDNKELVIEKFKIKHQKRCTKYLHIDSEKSHNLLLKAFAQSLDPHSYYLTSKQFKKRSQQVSKESCGIGINSVLEPRGRRVTKIYEGSAAVQALKINDIITHVNGQPIGVSDIPHGEKGDTIKLTIIREGTEQPFDATLKRIPFSTTKSALTTEPYQDGIIACIHIDGFYTNSKSSTSKMVIEALEKCKKENNVKGVILDLRTNLGGVLTEAEKVLGAFISQGVLHVAEKAGNQREISRKWDSKTYWDGPLIVLTDSFSASGSELLAQGLQDYGRALIVGDVQTYGKGSGQEPSDESDKPGYGVTTLVYHTVSGKTPQKDGVYADIVIPGRCIEKKAGEKCNKYPLENKRIAPMYDDDLSDLNWFDRIILPALFRYKPQQKLSTFEPYLEELKKKSAERIASNKDYQDYLETCKKQKLISLESHGKVDVQLEEAKQVMKDFLNLAREARHGI